MGKLLEKYYLHKHNKKNSKINKTNLINGIFDELLYDIFKRKITKNKMDKFCEAYILIIKNKPDRTFPRNSKTPFTKWYIKGYSDHTKLLRIIDCILNKQLDSLNKNDLQSLWEKMIANKIKDVTIK